VCGFVERKKMKLRGKFVEKNEEEGGRGGRKKKESEKRKE